MATLPEFGGMRRLDRQHAILPAAFDDVAELDEDRLVAGILDLELADVAGLVNDDGAIEECLLEGGRNGAGRGLPAHQVDGEVLVQQRLGDLEAGVGSRRRPGRSRRKRRQAWRQQKRLGRQSVKASGFSP